jgi:hypothetical protein
MRFFLCAAGLVALSACSPAVPDSAAGVGFGDYDAYQAERQAREARLSGAALPSPMAVSSEPLDGAEQAGDASDIAAETQAALGQQALNSGEPAPQTVTTATGMSVETNFDAVSAERSIESDAALIAQNRARYKVIEPEALPARAGSEPNIVQYALSSSHPVGTRVYSRVGVNSQARFQRNCAGYTSPDKAQIDFMSKGGPQRDRMGLDPDGDGYACGWDPSPFRKALGG